MTRARLFRGRNHIHFNIVEKDSTSNVADVFVETFIKAGVKRIYGAAGDSLNGLTDAIRAHHGIAWMMVRHEEVAAFAAGGESQITGQLTVCAGSCGPGNLHLINGLHDCQRSRVPVCATDGGWVEVFIKQVVQAALLNLRYQDFIEEVFRGAVTDMMYEDPTDIRAGTMMLRRPSHLKAFI